MAGEKPDRYAASFWRHFFHMEHHAKGTAEITIDFQKHFDWDFVKINPREDYHVEGWGMKIGYSHNEYRKHTKIEFPVKTVDDWDKIIPLGLNTSALAEHLKAVSDIRKGLGPETPILMTVFTPLSIAGRMVKDKQTLVEHITRYPDKILNVLAAITETFSAFVTELRNAGADGIFFATTHWASEMILTWEQYERFGIPFDLEVTKATDDGAINLLHVCSSHNFLSRLLEYDYHCRMYSWDSCDQTNIPIDEAHSLLNGKVMVGGVDQEGWLLKGTPDDVKHEIVKLETKASSAQLIIGPGCAIPPEVPMENLQAIRDKL